MPDFTSLYASYFKADDVREAPRTLTVTEAIPEEFDNDGKKKTKVVLYFKEDPRGWPLNPTNFATMKELFGDTSETWLGKSIQLVIDPNVKNLQGKRVGGIVVRRPN